MDKSYITDPSHGGKVTCHKCNGFIKEGDEVIFDHEVIYKTYFHIECFNPYEHYYGLDKPLD